jgi:hypothetical protein
MRSSLARSTMLIAALGLSSICGPAAAGIVVPCDGNCNWSVAADDVELARGQYEIDPETGNIWLHSSWSADLGDGAFVAVNGMSGNADPILGFSVAAGTGAVGKTFSFNFSLPVALAGAITASSSVSYSLTSLTAAGAQIDPLFGKVVVAQEVDTSIGGLSPLNKGVDVGNRFFFVGGPQTQSSPVYTATSVLTGDLAYDLMSVTVAFALSPNSQVGASGFVQQLPAPVPLPAAAWLLGSGLLALGGFARRRETAGLALARA